MDQQTALFLEAARRRLGTRKAPTSCAGLFLVRGGQGREAEDVVDYAAIIVWCVALAGLAATWGFLYVLCFKGG